MYRYSRPNVQTSIPAGRSPSCVAKNRCALSASSIARCPARCYSRERCQKPLGSEVPSNMRHNARLGGIILYYTYRPFSRPDAYCSASYSSSQGGYLPPAGSGRRAPYF